MIKSIKAREILDSRGNPTVEVTLFTGEGEFVSSVPSGASVGGYEAKELRDGGERYLGKGVKKAVESVNGEISEAISGMEEDPEEVDKVLLDLDGTRDKSRLGSNAILGVSMCVFKAAAKKRNLSLYNYISSQSSFSCYLPKACFNVINGGVHAGGGLEFQEFMIVPQEDSFSENLRLAAESYHRLKKVLSVEYGKSSTNIGDEGGFVPDMKRAEEALSVLSDLGGGIRILIDVAASEFFAGDVYRMYDKNMKRAEMIDHYKELVDRFPIIGLEDPLEENDFSGWSELSSALPEMLVVGDDLLATNVHRMEEAQKSGSCNAMILKINQIGSVSEAISAARKAREFGWKIIVSHRSGETNDDFIADFATGIGADYIKSGAPVRGERLAKYNRLLKVEEELSGNY